MLRQSGAMVLDLYNDIRKNTAVYIKVSSSNSI